MKEKILKIVETVEHYHAIIDKYYGTISKIITWFADSLRNIPEFPRFKGSSAEEQHTDSAK